MFKLFSKKPKEILPTEESITPTTVESTPDIIKEPVESPNTSSFFSRLKSGLSRTKKQLVDELSTLFLGDKEISADLIEKIETQLLCSDIGVKTTEYLIDKITKSIERKHVNVANEVFGLLKNEMTAILEPCEHPLEAHMESIAKKPFVILTIGVNGNGKTTTIGKLAKHYQNLGKSVMLGAGDTFRAAAVEQLKVWGDQNQVTVVAQETGADSASVCFDALQSAMAKNIDVLILDTAGRLHTKGNLIDELKKIKRVLAKLDISAPHEVLLVLDAGTGQNAVLQAQTFKESIGVSGIALTKLDGTAKGGVIFSIAHQLQIPLRYIGVGEGIDDLRVFNASQFVKALFNDTSKDPS